MKQRVEEIRKEIENELQTVTTLPLLEALKTKYLGKKGSLSLMMKDLREVSPEERPLVGKWINDLKEFAQAKFTEKEESVVAHEMQKQLATETLDITLPGYTKPIGREHVVTKALHNMIDILISMGFSVVYGPDVDSDYNVFEALNLGPDHPARDMQDTFYINPNTLLRTHTSNVQIRVMESHQPPIRIIAPGRAFRNEDISARSHVFFHQIEAMYIDKGVTFVDLVSTLQDFLRKLLSPDIELRLRPSYFPFVEPGMEVDVRCILCNGSGCNVCKQSGWLEVLGAGMIHPDVLRNGGIDPEVYSGFAWGMGVERLLLLKQGIPDIRYFTENDMRFLSQFSAL